MTLRTPTDCSSHHLTPDSGEPGQDHIVATPGKDQVDPASLPNEIKDAYVNNHVFYVQSFTREGKVVLGNPWGPPPGNPTITVDAEDYKKWFYAPEKINIP